MRAAVLSAFGEPLRIEEIELDPPRTGEITIRMAASGVCRSDWHAVRGVHPHALPIVLGHE
ncbi:MAG: alcohol dehydrogenase catalytic domain-containing protein, partial [Actinomycetota bacterium]